MYNYNSTEEKKSQATAENKILTKLAIKKKRNEKIISWLQAEQTPQALKTAENLINCGTYVGITNIENTCKIVKANFCRERICSVCAWRRQAKFVSQMLPVINILKENYKFYEVVLTIKNVEKSEVETAINTMLKAYDKLLKTRKIKRVWRGITRAIEITYNEVNNNFHPHIHMLVAVDKDYYNNREKYISHKELMLLWKDKLKIDYEPSIYIKSIRNREKGVIENLKYSLKPSLYSEAIEVFYYNLKGRRLISFSGIFADMRRKLKYSNIDDLSEEINGAAIKTDYNLYKFDTVGGFYKFQEKFKIEV